MQDEVILDQVKNQHLERCQQFLCDELQACAQEQVHHRVFFTSGKEMLNWKIRGSKFIPQPSHQFLHRKKDFDQFEKMLNHHLTSTSLNTKYRIHFITGKKICSELFKTLDILLDIADEEETKLSMEEEKISKLMNTCNTEMEEIAIDLKDELKVMMLGMPSKKNKTASSRDAIAYCSIAIITWDCLIFYGFE